jgi:hypothetical protein
LKEASPGWLQLTALFIHVTPAQVCPCRYQCYLGVCLDGVDVAVVDKIPPYLSSSFCQRWCCLPHFLADNNHARINFYRLVRARFLRGCEINTVAAEAQSLQQCENEREQLWTCQSGGPVKHHSASSLTT